MKKTRQTFAAGTLGKIGTAKFIAALPAIDGFTTVVGETNVHNPGFPKRMVPSVTVEGDGITMVATFFDAKAEFGAVDGSTSFSVPGGRRTFDRLGVESSFYLNSDATPAKFLEVIQEQIARVAKSRAASATALTVPGLGWSVQPAQKEEISAKLRAGRSHSFRPSGFGTGHTICVRKRSGWDKRAPAATAEFFGVPALFYSEDDCD